MAERGLGYGGFVRPDEIQFLRDADEVAQVTEFHAPDHTGLWLCELRSIGGEGV